MRLKNYFTRRLTRLEPPYIICMVLLFLSKYAADGMFGHLASSLIYSHNLIYKDPNPINNVAWSLEIEVQFYILAPLLARVFAIRKTGLRRGVLLGAILLTSFVSTFMRDWKFPPCLPGQIQYFLAGFLLVDLYIVNWNSRPRRSLAWDIGTALGAGLLYWNTGLVDRITAGGPGSLRWAMVMPPAILLMYVGTFRGRVSNYIFTRSWVVIIGGMCYTIYLYHNIVMSGFLSWREALRNLLPGWALLPALALFALAGTLIICAAIFFFLERPFMKKDWPRKVWEMVA